LQLAKGEAKGYTVLNDWDKLRWVPERQDFGHKLLRIPIYPGQAMAEIGRLSGA
jgi:hypothetical protein